MKNKSGVLPKQLEVGLRDNLGVIYLHIVKKLGRPINQTSLTLIGMTFER